MEGSIKIFNEEHGYGFINGEDEKEYFFHISNVKSEIPIKNGDYVQFEIIETEKGGEAVSVKLKEVKNKHIPAFIQVGNKRIRLKHIITYGIGYEDSYYIKVFEYNTKEVSGVFEWLFAEKYVWNGLTYEISDEQYESYMESIELNRRELRMIKTDNGEIKESDDYYNISESDLICKQKKYLYITTYSDYYEFRAINIDEKIKELDSYFK